MARSKSKAKSKSKPRRGGPSSKKAKRSSSAIPKLRLPAFERGSVLRFAVVCGWMGLILCTASGWWYAHPRLVAYASDALPREATTVRLPAFPAWLDTQATPDRPISAEESRRLRDVKTQIADEIAFAAQSRIERDLSSNAPLQRVHDALLETGWFAELRSVQRIGPNEIEIDGTFATPFTMIQDGSWNHLVDREGRLLPLQYVHSFRIRNLPLIRGARYAHPAKPGEHWGGGDVAAGLKLAEELYGTKWLEQIAEIDVSEFLHTEQLWIITDRGARILWGRAPGEERGIEVPAMTKIAYLSELYNLTGRIEGQYRELDITGDEVYVRR